MQCPPLFVVERVKAVVESTCSWEIATVNIPQILEIEVQFTFKAVIRHSIEEANCSPSETINGKCSQSANMYITCNIIKVYSTI